jgi:predicted transcriptional regulator
MTDLLERAVRTARALSPEMQDEIARMVLAYAGHDEPVIELTPEEEADLIEAQAEMERGEFATNTEVEAVFSKYRF